MIRSQPSKPDQLGGVAHGLLVSACVAVASLAFAYPASAAASSQADETTQQMHEECIKMSEEMKMEGDGMSMSEEAMSPEMQEMHEMCATVMRDADHHQHHGEG